MKVLREAVTAMTGNEVEREATKGNVPVGGEPIDS